MKEQIKPINALRGIFCLVIVAHHYFSVFRVGFLGNTVFEYFFRKGYLAVDMFFLLSGFCIAMNYEKRLSQDRKKILPFLGKHYLKFVLYSLITIPAWIAKQILCYSAGLDVQIEYKNIIPDILCVRTGWYVPSSFPYNGPMWFIDILLILYILYALICLLQSFIKKIDVSLILYIIIAIAAYAGQIIDKYNYFIWQGITRRGMVSFFLGCAIYRLYKWSRDREKNLVVLDVLSYISVVASVVLFILFFDTFEGETFIRIYILVAWPALLWLTLNAKWLKKVLSVKPLLFLGKYSNSIFIWHHPLFYILFSLILLGKIGINLGSPICMMCYLSVVGVIAFATTTLELKFFKK